MDFRSLRIVSSPPKKTTNQRLIRLKNHIYPDIIGQKRTKTDIALGRGIIFALVNQSLLYNGKHELKPDAGRTSKLPQ